MRIGNRLGGTMVGVVVAAWSALSALGEATEQVQPVPLGGATAELTGDRNFGVYVPTRFGGVLTIATTAGQVDALLGPDGAPRRNGDEVGQDRHGWYTFRVTGADKPYTVSTTFVQVGQAARMPWNYYYWPTKSDVVHEPWYNGNGRVDTLRPLGDDIMVATPGAPIAPGQDIIRAGPNGLLETPAAPGDEITWFPNLYDDLTFRGTDGTMYQTPSPMLKYDQLFGVNARGWEARNTQNQDIQRWPGHCLGAAIASILLNEPTPAPGTGLTKDELKALWAELGENHLNHQIGDNANNIPPGPPRPGPDETDMFVPRFHNMLETHIRGQRQALLANLRAFPPNGTNTEVWNHGVGKYTATFHPAPGKGERAVLLDVELQANSGSSLNNSDNKPRVINYEYSLVYGLDGRVDETMAGMADWVSVKGEGMFCPLNIMQVVQSRWQGHNPNITESNVRSLDMANGGSFSGRFAGAPPTFRPVGSYEPAINAGFGGLFARRNRNNNLDVPSPRQGGLFRFFGRTSEGGSE